MSKIFHPGQLVTPSLLVDQMINLFNVVSLADDDPRVVGQLSVGGIAMVVACHRNDGSSIYVIGSCGSGWTTGGLLDIIYERKKA
jgi:hypothetical protein